MFFEFSFVTLRVFKPDKENMDVKKRIIIQAGELFMKHGIKNVSMDEIASKLGISKRTIYQHFTDKEEVLLNFLDYTEKEQIRELKKLAETLPTITDIFLHILEMQRGTESFYCVRFQEDIGKYYPKAKAKQNELWENGCEMIKDFLRRGIKEGVVREDLNLDVTAFLLQDTSNTYIHASCMAARPFSIWELFFTMMVNFIRGISTEKGIVIIDAYLANQLKKEKVETI